jgi:hypothetical protein
VAERSFSRTWLVLTERIVPLLARMTRDWVWPPSLRGV